MERQRLNLKFKGDRSYIQGGDIFNALDRLVQETDSAAYISLLAFRRFARRDCDLLWDKPVSTERLCAQGVVSLTDRKRPFWVKMLPYPMP